MLKTHLRNVTKTHNKLIIEDLAALNETKFRVDQETFWFKEIIYFTFNEIKLLFVPGLFCMAWSHSVNGA